MAHVSHRLDTALAGALAGGGDPATSPLYVFGPFLRLLAASGVGAVCFGAPVWMVVGTVIVASLMYRHVMRWIPDGSGGSGLCEDEFGGWAVKVNASIVAIEYVLTFLVSIAALVTFIADRAHGLNRVERTGIAVLLAVAVGLVVNRGPRITTRIFGPATAAVLVLLWVLVGAVIVRFGLKLPGFDLRAFALQNIRVTLGGYVRLLALMTGIEVFANLVAAYEGTPEERSKKAFGSLAIVMATTLVTMVVVGPAIYALADPSNLHMSVFTQTMDQLLPAPVAHFGTLVGIVVLLSAAAASAQGLQNLALGLRHRHYVPASFGQRNRFDVADRPVYAQVAVVVLCFLALGTSEETYLALYAAGVFVLLGLTGWAAVKRLRREVREGAASVASLVTTGVAAAVTSGAAALMFAERFLDGAWAYALLVPALYAVFTHYRSKLGAPTRPEEQLGRLLADGTSFVPVQASEWPRSVLCVIDGTLPAESALVAGASVGVTLSCPVGLCCVGHPDAEAYTAALQRVFRFGWRPTTAASTQEAIAVAHQSGFDLVAASESYTDIDALVESSSLPLLIVSNSAPWSTRYPRMARVIVGLDGSLEAEATLPYAARFLGLGARVYLVIVPDGGSSVDALQTYGQRIAAGLLKYGTTEVLVGGSGPARTLIERAEELSADLVVVARHGQGGAHRAADVPLGSVPKRLIDDLQCSLLVVSAANAPSARADSRGPLTVAE